MGHSKLPIGVHLSLYRPPMTATCQSDPPWPEDIHTQTIFKTDFKHGFIVKSYFVMNMFEPCIFTTTKHSRLLLAHLFSKC